MSRMYPTLIVANIKDLENVFDQGLMISIVNGKGEKKFLKTQLGVNHDLSFTIERFRELADILEKEAIDD